jgi:hypothetical protein
LAREVENSAGVNIDELHARIAELELNLDLYENSGGYGAI